MCAHTLSALARRYKLINHAFQSPLDSPLQCPDPANRAAGAIFLLIRLGDVMGYLFWRALFVTREELLQSSHLLLEGYRSLPFPSPLERVVGAAL